MMDSEFVKWLATLGVGGAIAAIIYVYSQREVARHEKVIGEYTNRWENAANKFDVTVRDNTASTTKLIVMIENQERNALRKSDIELMINSLLDKRMSNQHRE